MLQNHDQMAEGERSAKRPRHSTQCYYCPHCRRDVAKSTWYLHHSQFFDTNSNKWQLANLEKNAVAKDQDSDASSDDFDFGDGDYTNLGGAEGGNNHEFEFVDTEENEELEGFLQENVSFLHLDLLN